MEDKLTNAEIEFRGEVLKHKEQYPYLFELECSKNRFRFEEEQRQKANVPLDRAEGCEQEGKGL